MPFPTSICLAGTTARLSLLVLFTLLLTIRPAQSQDAPELFQHIAEQPSLNAAQAGLLRAAQARATTKGLTLARLRASADLPERTRLTLNLAPGKHLTATMMGATHRADDDFTWVGKLKDPASQVLLVVKGEKMTGMIQTGDALYMIEPLGEGLHTLVEVDQSQYPPDETPDFSQEKSGKQNLPDHPNMTGKTASGSGSVIDLLVVYTGDAASASGDISGVITGAVGITNTALGNSLVTESVALVHQEQVTYSESGNALTDVTRLAGNGDGYIDNVHSLRDQYGADVVVLIVDNLNACGRVDAIGGSAGNAFAVVRWDCAVGNYTFAHEVGHLLGARHDLPNDPATSPYPWGHGYNYASSNWRTIMSATDTYNRIAYWSNPDQTLGSVPMGTYTYEDNARVWESAAPTVASFRTPPPPPAPLTVTISGPKGLARNEQDILKAWPSGGTGTYTYQWYSRPASSSTWTYTGLTTQSILVTMTGTEDMEYRVDVSSGSQTASDTHDIENCGTRGCVYKVDSEEPSASVGFSLDANYPNPFNPSTEISFTLPEASPVTLVVYDATGREVTRLLDGQLKAGAHRATWDANGLPSGVYFYRITAGTLTQTRHMVLAK